MTKHEIHLEGTIAPNGKVKVKRTFSKEWVKALLYIGSLGLALVVIGGIIEDTTQVSIIGSILNNLGANLLSLVIGAYIVKRVGAINL